MEFNMGTPNHPEGVAHWSVKTLMWHKLRMALKAQPRAYGSPLPRELRNIAVPNEWDDPRLTQAVERVMDRVDSRPGYSFVYFKEPPHDECEGGSTLVNILEGLRGGKVKMEESFAGYIPDISLYARDADRPSCIIEVVGTRPPSVKKLAAMKRMGITVYILDAKKLAPLGVMDAPVLVTRAVNAMCGESLRKEFKQLDHAWGGSDSPFVGIRNYKSGTQVYLVGEHDPHCDISWGHGEPEVMGLAKREVEWDILPDVKPVAERTRSISRDLFMSYLLWFKLQIIDWAHCRTDGDYGRLKRREALILSNINSQIDELLYMVRIPVG